MTRLGAWLLGALLGTAGAVTVIWGAAFAALPVLSEGGWPLLMGAVVIVCGFAGGNLGLCISVYGDLRRTVDLECRPLREGSTR